MAVPTMHVKNVTQPAAQIVRDGFSSEVRQENRRVTGVTPKAVNAYAESPARFLPRAKTLGALARAKRSRRMK